jgi:PIN domain nuclease of toxin-antitoxin system
MILDTCALLWLVTGSKKLSRSALKQIKEAPAVYISAVTGFEIALQAAKGRLTLHQSPTEWFEKVLEHHGLSVLPLDLNVCVRAAQLPAIHDDPCDRFIIATAKLNGFEVVTTDARFEEYGVTVLS